MTIIRGKKTIRKKGEKPSPTISQYVNSLKEDTEEKAQEKDGNEDYNDYSGGGWQALLLKDSFTSYYC